MEEKIIKDKMDSKATADFMLYASAVIRSRAIPLGEDGLKPVNRRILYEMGRMKIWSNTKTVKSAKVVGSVMGSLHPHGDASIYNAMVRLSQPWKMRYPLVEIQGNNGSVNGDPPAASRYTETRLSPIGELMLKGIDPEVVPFVPNFDNSLLEPSILPSSFPNILCNGNDGIAVGMSCGTMPHNLCEIVDLLKALIDNESLTTKDALKYVHGPDFPLGGTIIDGYKLPEIYESGKGTITLRANSTIDYNKKTITFSGFPYLVEIMKIIKSIKKMVIEDGDTDIEDVQNNVGAGCLTVLLSKKANPDFVLKKLYSSTPLQKTIKINQTIINGQVPMTLSLLGLCKQYLRYQHKIVTNIAKKEKAKQDKTVHMQTGLQLATMRIEEVVSIIRNSENKESAKIALIKLLGIDSAQADGILALKLSSLTKLDVNNIKLKIAKAKKESEYQATIIENKTVRNSLIADNLTSMADKYGDPRRTKIIIGSEQDREKEKNKRNSCMEVVFENGEFATAQVEKFADEFNKGGRFHKTKPVFWVYNDSFISTFLNKDGTTSDIYTNKSNSFRFLWDKNKDNIVTISRNGIIKKTQSSLYKNIKRLCKVKDGDSIIKAFCADENEILLLLLENGKATELKVSDIKTSGKLTIGKKYTTVKIEDAILGKVNDTYFTLNDSGQVKQGNYSELLQHNGAVIINDCNQIGTCKNNMFYKTATKVNAIDWSTIPIKSRTAVGSKIESKVVKYVG